MSNEPTIGFDCWQSPVWLQHVFPSYLCSQRNASIKGGNMDEDPLDPIDGVERLVRKLVQKLYPNLQELKNFV